MEAMAFTVTGLVVALALVMIAHNQTMNRRVARLERKLDAVLQHLGIGPINLFPEISERVKELAKDPAQKIQAIKAYREETGAGLAEAKEAIEGWMDANRKPAGG